MSLRLGGVLDLGVADPERALAFILALSGALIPTGAEPRTDATLTYARTTSISIAARVTSDSIPTRTTAVA